MTHQYSRVRGEGESPEGWLMQLLNGFMVTQYIHVAVKLGLPDRLAKGPRTAADLAAETGSDARSLHRLLRALASLGVFAETEGGQFTMTDLAEPLRTDSPSSLNGIARMYGEDWFWRPYGALVHSVKSGQTAFDHVYGHGFYEHLARDPEAGRVFDLAMGTFTASHAKRLVAEYDFGRFGRIMDVGGNRGVLLLSILRAFPQTRGVLFDREEVVRALDAQRGELDVGDRLELVGGDFLQVIPAGCDAYVLRNVLQDWDDEQATSLLSNCRKAMSEDSTLLVIGRLIEPGNDPYPGKLTDLTMMVLTGGRERTLAEHRALFERAGLSLGPVTRTSAMVAILEARRA